MTNPARKQRVTFEEFRMARRALRDIGIGVYRYEAKFSSPGKGGPLAAPLLRKTDKRAGERSPRQLRIYGIAYFCAAAAADGKRFFLPFSALFRNPPVFPNEIPESR